MKKRIEEYIEKGLLRRQYHPTLPLMIINYTAHTAYNRLWDDLTLMCRALVLDTDYNIVARSFPKFFNYEEHIESPELLGSIPTSPYKVYEKLDGYLGLAFPYKEEWVFASRGSFTSEMCLKAKEMFYKFEYDKILSLASGWTYCFEILYDRPIVIKYDKERLVLLDVVNKEGVSIFNAYQDFPDIAKSITENISSYEEMKKAIKDDEEGYVLFWSNGKRVKIKGSEYIRLHHLKTKVSNKVILDYLINNKPLSELLENCPDEVYSFIKKVVKDINCIYYGKLGDIYYKYSILLKELPNLYDRKLFAKTVLSHSFYKPYSAELFRLSDNQDISSMIWEEIKNNLVYEQPFSTKA